MAPDEKLDLLLRKMEENEKKRVAAEERSRADLAQLKSAMEARLPQVEKRVDDIASVVSTLSQKVEQLEGALQKFGEDDQKPEEVKEEHLATPKGKSSFQIQGMRDPALNSATTFQFDSVQATATGSLGSSLPPMTCPQFSGDNPQMWRANCEVYFDVYGVLPSNWVKVATLNFVGNTAFWLQSVTNQLIGITWHDLCERVCARFTRDRQQSLIRQWFHVKQLTTVADYVERFDSIMHQLNAYESAAPPDYFVTKFIDGLKDEVRTVVLVQRPQDLDTACSVALLQEEAMEGQKSGSYRKSEHVSNYIKPSYRNQTQIGVTTPIQQKVTSNSGGDDRRTVELARSRDDKLAALKAYRKSKGLCFICGERWGRDHKCANAVQLHVVQELMEAMNSEGGEELEEEPPEEVEEVQLLAISKQAISGTESSKSIRLRGWIQGTEVLMLIDSGSTHSFIEEQVGNRLSGVELLKQPLKVQIADGGQLTCTRFIPDCTWWMQGHSFKSNFTLIPLGSYDIILGMDWLVQHSPMHINWCQKWIEFQYNNSLVRLLGLSSKPTQFMEISGEQLLGMAKNGAIMYMVQLTEVPPEQQQDIPGSVQSLLQEYQDVFAEPKGLPPRKTCDHKIPLIEGAQPVNLRPYRYNPELKNEIEKQVAEMLQSGVIQHSQSAWSSPALLVRKKDGTWRMCVDYRHLNNLTIKSKYPVPIIEELLDELSGSKWFTKLDLRAGYHQIRMAPGEEHKTAFQTHSGHFEYKVMSFGLTGAPTTFQGAMNQTLSSVLRKCALVFFDDILVYSPDLPSHLSHLKQVLQLLRQDHWQVKFSKCSFAQQQVSYLGHVIGVNGVATEPKKIQDVLNWATPVSVKKLRGFLGLAGYYRKFVKNFGIISKPLTQLLRKGVPFKWSAEAKDAFQRLKQALTSAPVLGLPDFSKIFYVETDASEAGIGAVLSQEGHPIAYLSKALGPRSRGLSTYEKECMAILLAVDHWRAYLQHQEFVIITDHHSLVHLADQRLHTPWQQRAFTKLLGLQYKIIYRKGSSNAVADALSRKDCPNDAQVLAISVCTPKWMQEITKGYERDPHSSQLLIELSVDSAAREHFTLQSGLIRYKGRIWVGNNEDLQAKLISELHNNPIGGHSGFPVTYRRIKRLFAWMGMKKQVKKQLQQCQVCIQAKPERVKYPGLLQPLPVPAGAWQTISMDFIEGLPKSERYNCIFVVVDKFSKYAHFVPLTHPFTAESVATAFMKNIYKLHGMPKVIVSDRDKIFTSQFWEYLFTKSGTELHMSSSYHPQTDGQTERVNQCLELFLRCFVHSTPHKWAAWLHLAEFWYNNAFHSAVQKTPFEVIYGYQPAHFGISMEDCAVPDLQEWLRDRKFMHQLIQQHLHRAQQQMKFYANKNRTFREFQPGDWVYLKLQPYVQTSVARRANHKLSFKYYGPFEVLHKVGQVAYKLLLPSDCYIHPVVHVSQLRAATGFKPPVQHSLPSSAGAMQFPLQILDHRIAKKGNTIVTQILTHWSGSSVEDATWEDKEELRSRFPHAPAWGQAGSQGREDVRAH